MGSERKLRRQVDKDADLRTKIVKVTVEKCDGMFLLARLHMDTLSGARTRADLEDDLKYLPSGKDGLKQTYYESLGEDSLPGEERCRPGRKDLSMGMLFGSSPEGRRIAVCTDCPSRQSREGTV